MRVPPRGWRELTRVQNPRVNPEIARNHLVTEPPQIAFLTREKLSHVEPMQFDHIKILCYAITGGAGGLRGKEEGI